MFSLSDLTEEQLAYLEQYTGINIPYSSVTDISNALTAFTGPVRLNEAWLKFLGSKKKTKCLQCKQFMPSTPGDMVLVVTFEWHIHIKCVGKILEKLKEIEDKCQSQ